MAIPEMDVEGIGCKSVGWKVTTVPLGRVTKLAVLRPLEIVTAPDAPLMTVWPRESVVVTMADPALSLKGEETVDIPLVEPDSVGCVTVSVGGSAEPAAVVVPDPDDVLVAAVPIPKGMDTGELEADGEMFESDPLGAALPVGLVAVVAGRLEAGGGLGMLVVIVVKYVVVVPVGCAGAAEVDCPRH